MRVRERLINIMLCEEISNFLKVDKRSQLKEIYEHFVGPGYQNYVDYLDKVEKVRTELLKNNCSQSFFKLIEDIDEEKYKQYYTKTILFFLKNREYKRASDFMGMFERLGDTYSDSYYIIQEYYSQNVSVNSMAHAALGALLVGIGNDAVLSKDELFHVKSSLKKFYEIYPRFPIDSFSIGEYLKNNTLDEYDKNELLRIIQQAILSDGVILAKEREKFAKVLKSVTCTDVSTIPADFFSVLSIYFILLDNKLSTSEMNWYKSTNENKFFVHSVNSLFILLNILCAKCSIAIEYKEFFRYILRASQDDIDTAALFSFIYLVKIRKVEKVDQVVRTLSTFISSTCYQKILSMRKGVVIDEEIIIFMNLFCDQNTPRSNELMKVEVEYIDRLFRSCSKYASPLTYLAMTLVLVSDEKISKEEYDILWQQFEDLNIDPKNISRAIYDYNLAVDSDYGYIEYQNYLKDAS